MSWPSASAFFAMGGYGFYVWGAYAVAVACLVIDATSAGMRHRRAVAAARLHDDDARHERRPDRASRSDGVVS